MGLALGICSMLLPSAERRALGQYPPPRPPPWRQKVLVTMVASEALGGREAVDKGTRRALHRFWCSSTPYSWSRSSS